MRSKPYFLFLFAVFYFSPFVNSQDSLTKGRALYSLKTYSNGKPSVSSVIFNFSFDKYIQFFIRDNALNENLVNEIEKRKKNNAQDSSRYNDILTSIKEERSALQYQPTYSTLSSRHSITRWIEPYTKVAYCILDSLSEMVWEAADDTLTISGLFCQKAIGYSNGKKYEAWFTSSVPVSVAPFQFRGLPGLLVQVTNLTNKNFLSLIELNWPDKSPESISGCVNSKLISKEERDAIFSREDAKARNKANELMKAFEEKKVIKQE